MPRGHCPHTPALWISRLPEVQEHRRESHQEGENFELQVPPTQTARPQQDSFPVGPRNSTQTLSNTRTFLPEFRRTRKVLFGEHKARESGAEVLGACPRDHGHSSGYQGARRPPVARESFLKPPAPLTSSRHVGGAQAGGPGGAPRLDFSAPCFLAAAGSPNSRATPPKGATQTSETWKMWEPKSLQSPEPQQSALGRRGLPRPRSRLSALPPALSHFFFWSQPKLGRISRSGEVQHASSPFPDNAAKLRGTHFVISTFMSRAGPGA